MSSVLTLNGPEQRIEAVDFDTKISVAILHQSTKLKVLLFSLKEPSNTTASTGEKIIFNFTKKKFFNFHHFFLLFFFKNLTPIKKFLSNSWPKLQMCQISMRKNVLASLFKFDILYVWPFYQIIVVLLSISEKNLMSWLYLQI